MASLLVAPSVTPWRARIYADIRAGAHNPGVRKLYYNTDDGRISDIDQYYLSLPDANDLGTAVWEKLYSYTDAYGIDDVTASSLHELMTWFNSTAGEEDFQQYFDHNSVGVDHFSVTPDCDCDCKRLHLCSMRYVNYDEFNACYSNVESVVCG